MGFPMRHRLLIWIAAITLAPSLALAGSELLVNGGFDHVSRAAAGGPVAWTHHGDARLEPTPDRDAGGLVLALQDDADAWQDFPASGGQTFVIRGKVLQTADDGPVDQPDAASVYVEFHNHAGPMTKTPVVQQSAGDAPGVWEAFDHAATAPEGATFGRVVLTGAARTGTAYFDELSVRDAPQLEWSDEFDGTSLDTTKWIVVNAEDWWDCWYAPHNVEVSGGTLKLHSAEEWYNGKNWTGAKLEGRYHPQYKYLEARLRHSAADTKIWATWWTIGWQNNTWRWPPELDICEFGTQWEPNPSQTYHWDVGSGHTYDGANTGVDETQWHTYGVYWSPTQSPIFYVDGLITYAPGGPAEGFLMQALMILSSSPNRDDHYSGCPLATWEVDYVRVYDAPPEQPNQDAHLALNKPATASSEENSGLGPAKAVDGIATSRWASAWSADQWLRVDLQQTYTIDEVRIHWQYASAREYKVQVASAPSGPWTDCVHVTNNWDHEAWKTHTFAPRSGRYVRLLCIDRTTQWGYSVFEFEVYGAAPPIFPFDDDGDGDVDQADFDVFAGCLTGPDFGGPLAPACQNQDADQDGDVDLADFAAFQNAFAP